MLVVTDRIRIPLDEFEVSFSRSSGPGGQNVNKLNTKAQLRWAVTTSPSIPEDVRERFLAKFGRRITTAGELILVSQRFRDAARNEADCVDKLREMLQAVAQRPVPRRATKPTRASKEVRLKAKQQQSQKKRLRRRPGIED